jgi:hypothetical protein
VEVVGGIQLIKILEFIEINRRRELNGDLFRIVRVEGDALDVRVVVG